MQRQKRLHSRRHNIERRPEIASFLNMRHGCFIGGQWSVRKFLPVPLSFYHRKGCRSLGVSTEKQRETKKNTNRKRHALSNPFFASRVRKVFETRKPRSARKVSLLRGHAVPTQPVKSTDIMTLRAFTGRVVVAECYSGRVVPPSFFLASSPPSVSRSRLQWQEIMSFYARSFLQRGPFSLARAFAFHWKDCGPDLESARVRRELVNFFFVLLLFFFYIYSEIFTSVSSPRLRQNSLAEGSRGSRRAEKEMAR